MSLISLRNQVGESEESEHAVLTSRVRTVGCGILVLLALIESVHSRNIMQSDGISYLDMGDAILRADWAMAVNAHWSPLYPLLLGVAENLVRPSAYFEFAVVHAVNFIIFLFALACFDFLLRTSVELKPAQSLTDRGLVPLPRWAVIALGYVIFLWSSLSLITMERVSPDLLMAGFVYLALALLLRIGENPTQLWRFALTGAVLGVGYWAKTPVFPLAFVLFAFMWIVVGNWRHALPGVLLALVVFAAVAGPYVMAISKAKGRLTFGDSARFNYLILINDISPVWDFQNIGTARGQFKHPVRKIFDSPATYDFSNPIKGTIPVWYDPSYWIEGAVPRLILRRQLSVIHRHISYYLDLLFSSQAAILVGFIILCFQSEGRLLVQQLRARWPIWMMGLAGLGMYALVLAEPRYVAAFFTLCWVGLFSGLVLPPGRATNRVVAAVTLAVALVMAAPPIVSAGKHLIHIVHQEPHDQWQVSEGLRKLGVTPGDRVGRIGGRFLVGWARLLRITVVAEVPHANASEFWNAKPEVQAEVIDRFRHLGVTALVAEKYSVDDLFKPGPGWVKLGDDRYYGLRLTPEVPK